MNTDERRLNEITEKVIGCTYKSFDEVHMAQCLNYLKATGIKVCLLINFAKPQRSNESLSVSDGVNPR